MGDEELGEVSVGVEVNIYGADNFQKVLFSFKENANSVRDAVDAVKKELTRLQNTEAKVFCNSTGNGQLFTIKSFEENLSLDGNIHISVDAKEEFCVLF